jgi:valyl-tRNA synthetase
MSVEEIPKNYDPQRIEEAASRAWKESDAFRATPDERDAYVVMMPLPNITGALHMGHAIDNVMQDMLIRWNRMQGKNTLWQPGTDHAGIATQAVVEKRLFEREGKTRHDIGREALVQRIFDWKDAFQARIIGQQEEMGCSCDWHRQRFTMDPVCARAVRECFFRLFQDQLIYQGDRLINLDCHLQTAVADDEVITVEVEGHFWHIRYPVIDPQEGEPEFVVVATTRPETMLGDTAVACHPDPRGSLEASLVAAREKLAEAGDKERAGAEAEVARLEERIQEVLPTLETLKKMAQDERKVMLPLQDRPIPLILDEWAKPELGSGCVKVTPAHDPNDYEVWKRHQDEIGLINLLQTDGVYNRHAGAYRGMDRYAVRDKLLEDLDTLGLLLEIEDRLIPIGHSDRSKTPIEPYLSKQWFVRMGDVPEGLAMGRGTAKEHRSPGLAQAAIDAVKGDWTSPSGLKLTFFPDHQRYGNMYLRWLEEKRDWCISRQLWWGHRIPIWTAEISSDRIRALIEAVRPHHGESLWLWFADEEGRALGLEAAANYHGEEPLQVQLCLRSEQAESAHAALLNDFQLVQDPDVLDTWFSSALWPFSTLGWPEPDTASIEEGQTFLGAVKGQKSALETYFPGSCLVTGRDIITLWVARMTIMGLYLLGDVPFPHSFIHANILDGKGERMSKSKGNGIDPLDIIQSIGADAMRYVLCELQTGNQDIRIPVKANSPFTGNPIELLAAKHRKEDKGKRPWIYLCPETGKAFDVLGTEDDLPRASVYSDRFDVGKSFCTKLWNAARFAYMGLGAHAWEAVELDQLEDEDRWILSRLDHAIEAIQEALLAYAPSTAVGTAREFFWGDLCDWYLELIKPRMRDEERAPVARTVLSYVLDQVLRLLHPFIPFLTEELWGRLALQCPTRGLDQVLPGSELLIRAPWPSTRAALRDLEVEQDFALLREVVRGVRDVRARYTVSPKIQLSAAVQAEGETLERLQRLLPHLKNQAGLAEVELSVSPERPPLSAKAVIGDVQVFLAGVLDPVKERKRLDGQKAKIEKNLAGLERRLGNPKFAEKAPPEVVEQVRKQLAEAQLQLQSVNAGLEDLAGT